MASKSLYRNLTFAAFVSVLIIGYATSVWADDSAETEDDSTAWNVQWKDNLRMDSPDGKWKLKAGGRFQYDYQRSNADGPLGDTIDDDVFGTRRARLFLSGTGYKRFIFKAEYDFQADNFADLIVGVKSDWGTVRLGHHKDPFSLEEQISANHLTFIERSLPIQALSPQRSTGISATGTHGERVDWSVGYFYDTTSFGQSLDNKDRQAAARVVYRPFFDDDKYRLVHVGFAVIQREHDSTVRFRARPEARFTGRPLDTGSFAADSTLITALELSLNHGQFQLDSEYMRADVDTPSGSDPSIDGLYVSAGYFLTKDRRTYSGGKFRRVRPTRDLLGGDGTGAWQVAMRYSNLDLDKGSLQGGSQDNWTFALNWYPTHTTRLMLNWIDVDVKDSSPQAGNADLFLVRWQVEF